MSFWWWMLIRENIMSVQGQSLYDITLIALSSTVNLKQHEKTKSYDKSTPLNIQ